eukprot:jgi/Hompol1/343/HPOL_004245-RA
MFIYLSKKIAIPNCANLRAVAWNNDQGWIACGGDDGLLKVLKLESNVAASAAPVGVSTVSPAVANSAASASPVAAQDNGKKPDGAAAPAPSQLSMNQTLEGHQGMWYEEMINNRNKSVVTDMQWNKDGQKICIVYEDGAVILGSVDGNRIWGKEIKNTQLSHVQWSPDGKFLLFGTGPGEIQLFDSQGIFVSKVPNFCDPMGNVKIAAVDWYNGSKGNMKSLRMKWNINGTVLAISGLQFIKNNQGEEKETCVVQFWTPTGQFLRSLKVPGKKISSMSWEYDGLRIALAVDSFIYFANIRPDYKWSFFAHDVLVFAYNKPEATESTIVFWNTKTNDRRTRSIPKMHMITSAGDHCLIVSKSEDDSQQCLLTVYNAIGTPLETKSIEFEPKFATVSRTNVFVASADLLLHWQFKILATTKMSALDAIRRKDVRERAFHIDDISIIGSGDAGSAISDLRSKPPSNDPIACITSSDSVLLIARQSGTLYQYIVPSVTLDNKYTTTCRPQSIALNCNSTRASILDIAGVFKLFDLEKKGVPANTPVNQTASAVSGTSPVAIGPKLDGGYMLDFERKDVWDVRWASDNPEMFTIMEKTRMYIFRNVEPEEPLNCAGYICDFEDLQIKTILLDDIMKDPDGPIRDMVVHIETKTFRDLRTILSQSGLVEAVQFVEDRPHPRLWKIVAEASLELLDFQQAQKAFV